MVSGIGASITSFSPGTLIASATANANFASLNSSGVSNDGGNITTDGAGTITSVGITTQVLKANPPVVSVNGQTSGVARAYQVLQGTVKRVVVQLSNYRITANQTLVLPVAFSDRAVVWVGETNGGHIAFLLSGAAQNIKVVTALSGTGGTQSTQTFVQQWSQGQIDAGWDTIQFQSAAQIGAANGTIIIEGF